MAETERVNIGCALAGKLRSDKREGERNDTNDMFMYLRAIFCTFQISVDFHYVPVGGRGGGRWGAGEGEGARERGIECILYGYT